MAMNHPSTPPSSSDGDLQGSLGRYAAHTPSSVNPNFYDLQISPYEYFGSEVGDQYVSAPDMYLQGILAKLILFMASEWGF